MNVLGDSIGCAFVQANVDLEPVKKIEEAVETDWSFFKSEIRPEYGKRKFSGARKEWINKYNALMQWNDNFDKNCYLLQILNTQNKINGYIHFGQILEMQWLAELAKLFLRPSLTPTSQNGPWLANSYQKLPNQFRN